MSFFKTWSYLISISIISWFKITNVVAITNKRINTKSGKILRRQPVRLYQLIPMIPLGKRRNVFPLGTLSVDEFIRTQSSDNLSKTTRDGWRNVEKIKGQELLEGSQSSPVLYSAPSIIIAQTVFKTVWCLASWYQSNNELLPVKPWITKSQHWDQKDFGP